MKIIITVLLSCILFPCWSQKLRYKDLVTALRDMSDSEQTATLREYIQYDLDNPNANFRLALLHEKQYRLLDPLTQYEEAMAHGTETVLRFTKSRVLVNQSEVNHDNSYYADLLGTPDSKGRLVVAYPAIQAKIKNGFDSASQFVGIVPHIYSQFTKSVNNYDQAVKLYASINNNYKTEEDIYMLFNVSFDQQLTLLKQHYDSSLLYFENYKNLLGTYPLPNYHPNKRIKTIKTYRLDGLINHMTFLEPDVEFWNYGEWVDRIRKTKQSTVADFLKKLMDNEEKVTRSLNNIPGKVDAPIYTIEKDLIYNLGNYDKNSLALALLKYKEFKQWWLADINKIQWDTLQQQKLDLYSTLLHQNKIADSLMTLVQSKITAINIEKHKAFLDKYYSGERGVNSFVVNENKFIRQCAQSYQSALKQNLFLLNSTAISEGSKVNSLRIGQFTVPLHVSNGPPEDLDNTTLITRQLESGADGSIYVSGVYKPDKKTNNLQSYIARINADGKASWIKAFNYTVDDVNNNSRNEIHKIVVTSEGVAAICHVTDSISGNSKNEFVYLNDKGDIKVEKELSVNSFPRHLAYLETSNSFLVACKGTHENVSLVNDNPAAILNINIEGDLIWSQEISFAGSLTQVVPVKDGYIMIGNYTTMKDLENQSFQTNISNGQTSPYLAKVSLQGEMLEIKPFVTQKSLIVKNVYKLNDNAINLIAVESNIETPLKATITLESTRLLMVDYSLRKICSEW